MCTACALRLGARRRSCPPKVVRHSRALLADRSATVVRQTSCCPASPLRPCSEEVKARENADRKSQVGSFVRCLGVSIGFGGRVGLCGAASDTEISVGGRQLPACLPATSHLRHASFACRKPLPLQLTDEATTGDNPQQQMTRDEHQILDSDVGAASLSCAMCRCVASAGLLLLPSHCCSVAAAAAATAAAGAAAAAVRMPPLRPCVERVELSWGRRRPNCTGSAQWTPHRCPCCLHHLPLQFYTRH